ncbi:MAG: Calcium-transporting ATPase 1 [Tenericutes bacterium ADurb.Bin239]|nr:MAG: Calcium-transporting ATPase 1 [Tenericutes bacterium ADurb.Bin239]
MDHLETKKKRPGTATTIIKKSEIKVDEVIRYSPKYNEGLSTQQVNARKAARMTNEKPNKGVKSIFSILMRNLFSFFNILLYVIGAALIYIKEWQSLLFLVILFFNIMIGLIQDLRARHTLKKLLILNEQRVIVVRDGIEIEVATDDVVLDDIIKLKLGDQIAADGLVVHGAVGVNESLLTGEPNIVHKGKDDRVLSGSFVTTGTCYYLVDTIGKLGYAQKLQLRAKVFKRPTSELLNSINSLFKVIGFIVIGMALLMIFNGFYQGSTFEDSVRSIAGSLVAMIPSGMYLLTSMTLAVGVIRLGSKNTLVNEMYSIEMLARVNVLCLDKTGTITDGTMKVNEVVPLKGAKGIDLDVVVATILRATKDENPTALALKKHFTTRKYMQFTKVLPFNSESKCSGAIMEGKTYIMGASSMVLGPKAQKQVEKVERIYLERGLRVLVLAISTKPFIANKLPIDLEPLALIIIQDNIRAEAYEVIKLFQDNGVEVKIISGDDPVSVSEIARQVGINNAESLLDFSSIDDPSHHSLEDFTIYGRVRPEQKEGIVTKLQSDGKVVAMIGDGVNDVLALKAAQCSIAMGAGSPAARGVSHLVLLDNNFDVLPSIVDEGRRAINNLQKTWSLFLVKTIFAIIFSFMFVTAGLLGPKGSGIRYPFEPKHLYIWELLSLGIPAFFLSMQPNKERVKGTFMDNVIRRSVPAGILMVVGAFMLYTTKNFGEMFGMGIGNTSEEMITMSILTISFLSFVILFRNSLPFNRYRLILFLTLSILAVGVIVLDNTLGITFTGPYFLDLNLSVLQPIHYGILIIINLMLTILYVLADNKIVKKLGRE